MLMNLYIVTDDLFKRIESLRAIAGSTLRIAHFFFFFLAKALASASRRSSSSLFFLNLISSLNLASYSSTCLKNSGYRLSSSARYAKS